jgi:FkbM family methyltransferase
VIKIYDFECKLVVRNQTLYIPLSHPLAFHVAKYPHYDGMIERIADFVRKKYGKLICLDVGANIGDTIKFCNPQLNDRFLGIESDSYYTKLYNKNVGYLENVELSNTICSSSDGYSALKTYRDYGTATLIEDMNLKSQTRTLDSILMDLNGFDKANFLKIDTDGYDFEVIRGAKNLIQKNKPLILFECDAFRNQNYIEEFQEIMNLFKTYGYHSAIVYDNNGFFYSIIDLDFISDFKYSLFYQLTSDFFYFDILVMTEKDYEQFYQAETSFFINEMQVNELKNTAKSAIKM